MNALVIIVLEALCGLSCQEELLQSDLSIHQHLFGSIISCYELDISCTPIIMGYSRNQLISLRNSCLNDCNSYVSTLKENGLFKYSGPRGCRAGAQVKNRIHKISTVITNVECSSSVTPSRSRSRVTRSLNSSQFLQSDVSSQTGINVSNLVKVPIHRECSVQTKVQERVNVSLVNAQSLNNKTQDFLDYLIGTKADLCFITETFLTDLSTVTRAALQPAGYGFSDQPRLSGDARGGTGIFFRTCFKVAKTNFGQHSSFEFSEWLVTWSNKRLKLCIIYHPPPSQNNPISNGTFLDEFDSYLEHVVLCDELLCICGDFNIHMNKPQDPYQIRLSEILKCYGLVNNVHVPTHKLGNTLDFLITWDNEEIHFSPPTAGYMMSDHYFVHTKLAFPRPNLSFKTITYRKIKDIDVAAFNSDLASICDDLLQISDINVLATQYNKLLGECLDKHAPALSKTCVVRPKVPWYSDTLKQMKLTRRNLERTYRHTKSDADY